MKKLLLLLCVFLSTAVRAQEFYEPSDLDVMWRVWDDEWTFNWLIENGNKVDVSVNPAPRYSHSSVVAPTEVCLSFVKNNKFLCLTFSKSEGIRMFTENQVYTLANHFSSISSLVQQYWFNIDFDRIVFNEVLGWLLIPCGYYGYTGYNAIAINFADMSAVNEVKYLPSDEDVEYYNLQGMKIDEEDAKGQILIRKEGAKSTKIMRR